MIDCKPWFSHLFHPEWSTSHIHASITDLSPHPQVWESTPSRWSSLHLAPPPRPAASVLPRPPRARRPPRLAALRLSSHAKRLGGWGMARWKQEVSGEIVGCSCWKFLCKNPVAIAFWINTWDKCYTKRKVLLLNILVFLRISWRSLGWVLDPTPIKKAQKSSPVQENKLPPPNHQWWHLTYPGMFEDSGNPTTMAGGIIPNFCQYLWTAIFIPLAR